jgi:hypothetical protein
MRIAVLAVLGLGAWGCAGIPRTGEAPDRALFNPPTFGWVDPDAASVVVAVHTVPFASRGDSARPETYHYRVRPEPSGVAADLRAVVIDGDHAYAAGDGGVVLHRTGKTGWTREATPTVRTLRALIGADAGEIYAVGDAGTVLRRSANGAWGVEPAPTTADLYDLAVARTNRTLYAVGDHGTLLERRNGTWHAIASHTEADLRQFDGTIAVGRDGAVVDCELWDRDRSWQAHQLVCVPRPSPTHADLLAMAGEYMGWHAYGAEGTALRALRRGPIDVALDAPVPGGAAITAASENRWFAPIELVTILVGTGGHIEFVGTQPTRLVIAGSPDLFGVATAGVDAFAVGAAGTIVHLQATDVEIPPAVEE